MLSKYLTLESTNYVVKSGFHFTFHGFIKSEKIKYFQAFYHLFRMSESGRNEKLPDNKFNFISLPWIIAGSNEKKRISRACAAVRDSWVNNRIKLIFNLFSESFSEVLANSSRYPPLCVGDWKILLLMFFNRISLKLNCYGGLIGIPPPAQIPRF